MIISESCVASDISKVLKDSFSSIQFDSIIKRVRRFFLNKLFDPYFFYKKLIIYVLKSFKSKHDDKFIYITFDHMFSKHNYTVIMFTMRIGTFGIPIWFKCFKNYSNNDAFKLHTMHDGIISVSSLFNNNLGHIYCVRLKGNITVYKDGKKIKKRIMSLFNVGLTLFHIAFNSIIYIRIPLSFKLYDI